MKKGDLGSISRMRSGKLRACEFSSYSIQPHPSVAFRDCAIYPAQYQPGLQCSEARQYSGRFKKRIQTKHKQTNKRNGMWFPQNHPLRKSSPGGIPGVHYRVSQPGHSCCAIPHSILSQSSQRCRKDSHKLLISHCWEGRTGAQ